MTIESLMSRKQVLNLVTFSASTLRRLVDAREFPAPVQITARLVAWRQADIREWIAQRQQSLGGRK